MSENRKCCPMRHQNGNCLPMGGFCTAVNEGLCAALHNAYESGRRNALLYIINEVDNLKVNKKIEFNKETN